MRLRTANILAALACLLPTFSSSSGDSVLLHVRPGLSPPAERIESSPEARRSVERPSDSVLLINGASEMRRSGLGSLVGVLIDAIDSEPPLTASWRALASELGYSDDELFDRLLGDRFAVLVDAPDSDARAIANDRASTDTGHWAVVCRVSASSYARLRERLKPAPRSVVGSWQILSLEDGRFELAARHTPAEDRPRTENKPDAQTRLSTGRSKPDPHSRDVEVVLGPTARSTVFSRVVSADSPQIAAMTDRDPAPFGTKGRCLLSQLRTAVGLARHDPSAAPSVHFISYGLIGERSTQSRLRASLTRGDELTDRWDVDIEIRSGDETSPAGPRGELTGNRLANIWVDGGLFAAFSPIGFSGNRFSAGIGSEILRQIGLSSTAQQDHSEVSLIGLRLDSPERSTGTGANKDHDSTAGTLPTLTAMLRLTNPGSSPADVDGLLWPLAAGQDSRDPGRSEGAEEHRLTGFAPNATRCVSISSLPSNDPAVSESPSVDTNSTTLLKWSKVHTTAPNESSVPAFALVSVLPGSRSRPTAGLPKGDAVAQQTAFDVDGLHRAIRVAASEATAHERDAGSLEWLIAANPSEIERLWPDQLSAWPLMGSAFRRVGALRLRLDRSYPAEPAEAPAADRQAHYRGSGSIHFVLPEHPAATRPPQPVLR